MARRWSWIVLVVGVLAPAVAMAQEELPASLGDIVGKVDDVSIHLGAGWLPRSPAYARSYYDIGFEVTLHLGYIVHGLAGDLAVGIDQLSGLRMPDSFRGSMRTLPSLSLYLESDSGPFAGFSSGLVQMRDMRFFGPPPPFSPPGSEATFGISGETVDLGVVAGYAFQSGVMAALSFRWRYFPSLGAVNDQTFLQPAEIPHSLDASGLMFQIGYQFSVRRRRARSSG
jgi:hypothetical protein